MAEILFNEKINDYTLQEEIEEVKSIKKVPIRFKLTDSTSRFRKDILKKEILTSK
jgi:rRNA maturation protein Nop10